MVDRTQFSLRGSRRRPRPTRRTQLGFTLIEMMVALLIGMVLVGAVLVVQLNLTSQNVRMSDIGVRDNETRSALDMVRRDLSGAGFLFGGLHRNCDVMLAYNSAAPGIGGGPGYFPVTRVAAMAGGPGVQLPFTGGTGFTVSYPAAGSPNRSDVLVIRSTLDATRLTEALSPSINATTSATISPTTSGMIPLANTAGFNLGDMVVVQVPVGIAGNQSRVCMRNQVSAVVVNTSVALNGTGTMPANFYAGFSGQMANYGVSDTLSNVLLQNAKVTNLGSAAAAQQVTYVYFVDYSSAANWPRLVRAQLNTMTETEIAGTRQDIAAGVVSMQVLFGVDPANTGAVTAYQTGAQVVANQNYDDILCIKLLLVTRSINADPKFTNSVNPINVTAQYNENGYTNYTIPATPASEMQFRYTTQEEVISLRNNLWADN